MNDWLQTTHKLSLMLITWPHTWPIIPIFVPFTTFWPYFCDTNIFLSKLHPICEPSLHNLILLYSIHLLTAITIYHYVPLSLILSILYVVCALYFVKSLNQIQQLRLCVVKISSYWVLICALLTKCNTYQAWSMLYFVTPLAAFEILTCSHLVTLQDCVEIWFPDLKHERYHGIITVIGA